MRPTSPRLAVRSARAIPALALFVALGCTEITSLKQENQGALSVETLYTPGNATLLVNGAIADFECAYNRYVVGSGLLSDELTVAIAQSANFDYDARRLLTNASYGTNNCGSPTPSSTQQPGIYTPLSVARATADTAAAKLETWSDADVPNRQKLLGQAATYAGYSLILLGEGMCSAALNLGPELAPADLFTEAVARFTKAIPAATAAGDATTLNLARLGRARAAFDLSSASTTSSAANLAAAAADAGPIPASFVVNTSPDAVNARRQNVVFLHISQFAYSTVDSSFRNVPPPGATTGQDPRVVVIDLNRKGTATRSQLFIPAKDATVSSPVRLASYAEAQLIIAENAARTGDLNAATTAINNARSRTPGLPSYTRPTGATSADVLTQIAEERRRELFMEGHRLGDFHLGRYGLQLVPAAGADYPYGGKYGSQVCFPLPDVERINNPTLAGKP